MKAVQKKFDKDGDGIGLNEFLCQLKEPMNDRRAAMVKRCFTCMDRDGSGVIEAGDVKALYNAKENPDVIQGKKTESQVLEEFLNGFDGTEGDNDGRITAKEWLDYYNELSMGIPNDDQFVEMLCSTWMILETAELSAQDKATVKNCLSRLKAGLMQKCPPMMSLDAGIRNIFNQYDKDKGGFITINELNALCLGVGVPLERKYTMRIMKFIDKGGDGTISLEELSGYIQGKKTVA